MHSGKPLKIVLLYSSGHLGSNIILNKILKMNCYEVVGIVKAQIIDFTPAGFQKVQNKYHKLGLQFSSLLLWQRIIQSLSFTFAKVIPENSKILKTSRRISEKIPCFSCQNINTYFHQATPA